MKTNLLDRMLEPLVEDLTVSRARKLVALRADPSLQARVDLLADKANEGTLSEAERAEYEHCRAVWHLLSRLQLRARKFLMDADKP